MLLFRYHLQFIPLFKIRRRFCVDARRHMHNENTLHTQLVENRQGEPSEPTTPARDYGSPSPGLKRHRSGTSGEMEANTVRGDNPDLIPGLTFPTSRALEQEQALPGHSPTRVPIPPAAKGAKSDKVTLKPFIPAPKES